MLAIGYRCNYASYDVETAVLGDIGVPFQHVLGCNEIQRPEEVVALFVRQEEIDRAFMDQFANLKVIQRYGVGTDNIDMRGATDRGIRVCNTPQYGQENEVSTHAVALYLGLSRHLLTRDADVRNGKWDIGQSEPILGNKGMVLGLFGYGQIARKTKEKFDALGFGKTLVVDPALSAEAATAAGVELVPLEQLLNHSDVVSLHAPLNGATKHIINDEALAMMKSTAYLINVSRGGLVDENALSKALSSEQLAGAGIDVFESEPPEYSSTIMSAPNTILTDHMAWYSEAAVLKLQTAAAQEVSRVLSGDNALYACA